MRTLRITTLALCLVCGTAAFAAHTGLKLGASVSQWKFNYENTAPNSIMNITNFTFAGVLEFDLTDYLSLQVEPSYTRHDFDMDYRKAALEQMAGQPFPSSMPSTLTFTQSFVSIDCPVLLKLSFFAKGIRPYIFAGPNPSINVSATCTAKFDTTNMNLASPITVKPSAKAMIFSFVTGAGVQVPLIGPISLIADARYAFALSDASSFSAFGKSAGNAKASSIVVLVGAEIEW